MNASQNGNNVFCAKGYCFWPVAIRKAFLSQSREKAGEVAFGVKNGEDHGSGLNT
jgi:hypothetical protein